MAGQFLKNITSRFTKEGQYHSNLLGESLQDQLKQATSKTLDAPDEECNTQVVQTIQQEIASGKDPKEIVGLLKKRLHMDNPHKQWLAVLLIGKVMRECDGLGMYQEELLHEVARVMSRPAHADTEAGKRARQAAKDLLRSYGRAAANAFRQVHREGRQNLGLQLGTAAYGGAAVGHPANPAVGYDPAAYGALPPGYTEGMSAEKASVLHETQMLIDQAKANTELLSDMLVNSEAQADEFERELTADLLKEVRELRDLFTAYLEQLQSFDGPEVESVLIQALEAADMLDGALALEKEVELNQREADRINASIESAEKAKPAAAEPAAAAGAGDLISLDDEPSTSAQPAVAAAAPAAPAPSSDPFDNLTFAPSSQPAAPAAPAAPLETPAMAGMSPAFANMFQQPPAPQPYAAMPVPAGVQQPYAPMSVPAAAPQPVPQYPTMQQYYGVPPTPGYGSVQQPAVAPAASNPNNPFAAPLPSTTPQLSAGNPFASLPPAPAAQVDAEWDMFFANRAATNQPAAGNVNADFDVLMGKK